MGGPKKAGTSGAVKNYITRTQAVKRLQCSLADFRRMCIIKGIHPHQPNSMKKLREKNSKATPNTNYYYVKDIQELVRSDLLTALREEKAFAKKLAKAIAQQNWRSAQTLQSEKDIKGVKGWRLDLVIKERYPTFASLIPHLSDPLSLLSLFASLPVTPGTTRNFEGKGAEKNIPEQGANLTDTSAHPIGPNSSSESLRLLVEFKAWAIREKRLRKVFFGIKGVWWEVELLKEGQGGLTKAKDGKVVWCEPWGFVQNIPADIDFRIMATFLEFYQTLLGFTLFKLYSDANLNYPPNVDLDKDGGFLGGADVVTLQEKEKLLLELGKESEQVVKVKSGDINRGIKEIVEAHLAESSSVPSKAQKAMERPTEAEDSSNSVVVAEDFPLPTSANENLQPVPNEVNTSLFSNYTFYLDRSVPLPVLSFLIRAFSGRVLLPSTTPIPPSTITHYVVDRPNFSSPESLKDAKVAYVQPQWLADCVNRSTLLPTDMYAPGRELPSHLSPWVDHVVEKKRGAYIPEEALLEGEKKEEKDEEDEESEGEDVEMEDNEEEEWDGIQSEGEKEELETSEKTKKKHNKKRPLPASDDEDDTHAAELEAERKGLSYSEFKKDSQSKASKKRKLESKAKTKEAKAEEAKEKDREMRSALLTGQTKRLYKKLAFTEKKNKEQKEKLEAKKKELKKAEKQKAGGKKRRREE